MSAIRTARRQSARRLSKSTLGQFALDRADDVDRTWRELISHRTSAALRHKLKRGEHVGAPPYGYRVDGCRFCNPNAPLVEVEDEQLILSQMVIRRSLGVSFRGIADELTRAGVPTKLGGKWHAATVQRAIQMHERRLAAAGRLGSGVKREPPATEVTRGPGQSICSLSPETAGARTKGPIVPQAGPAERSRSPVAREREAELSSAAYRDGSDSQSNITTPQEAA